MTTRAVAGLFLLALALGWLARDALREQELHELIHRVGFLDGQVTALCGEG